MPYADLQTTNRIAAYIERVEEEALFQLVAADRERLAGYFEAQMATRQARKEKAAKLGKKAAAPTEYALRMANWIKDVREELLDGHQGRLRSDEYPILKLFVAKLHRASKLRFGKTKGTLFDTFTKLGALEERYIEFNKEMVGLIRTDLDGVWDSEEHFREDLEHCLDTHAWPAIAVCSRDDQGRVIRPHVYHIIGDSVSMDRRAGLKAQRLLRATRRGLVEALLPMRADPGALRHALHGKNPCCRQWDVIVLSGRTHDLSTLCEYVRMDVSEAELFRRAAEDRAGPEVTLASGQVVVPSNEFFNVLQAFSFDLVARHHKAGGGFDEFRALVISHALEISTLADEDQAKAIGYRVADWTWANFDPKARQKARVNRGRLMHLTEGMTVRERQQLGQADGAERRRQSSVTQAAEAYGDLALTGEKPTQKAVAVASGVGYRTVQRWWSSIVEGHATQCIDKKGLNADIPTETIPEMVMETIPTSEVTPDGPTVANQASAKTRKTEPADRGAGAAPAATRWSRLSLVITTASPEMSQHGLPVGPDTADWPRSAGRRGLGVGHGPDSNSCNNSVHTVATAISQPPAKFGAGKPVNRFAFYAAMFLLAA